MVKKRLKNNFKEIIIILVVVEVLLLAILVVDSVQDNYGKSGKYGKEASTDKRWAFEEKGRGGGSYDKTMGYDSEMAGRTRALVERAISDYKADAEKTLNSVKEAVYVQDDLYVFAVSGEYNVAHPYRKDFENTKLTERKDVNGFYYGKAIAGATESGKWIDYVFTVPGTNDQALKSTYCKKIQEHILCAGYYHN